MSHPCSSAQYDNNGKVMLDRLYGYSDHSRACKHTSVTFQAEDIQLYNQTSNTFESVTDRLMDMSTTYTMIAGDDIKKGQPVQVIYPGVAVPVSPWQSYIPFEFPVEADPNVPFCFSATREFEEACILWKGLDAHWYLGYQMILNDKKYVCFQDERYVDVTEDVQDLESLKLLAISEFPGYALITGIHSSTKHFYVCSYKFSGNKYVSVRDKKLITVDYTTNHLPSSAEQCNYTVFPSPSVNRGFIIVYTQEESETIINLRFVRFVITSNSTITTFSENDVPSTILSGIEFLGDGSEPETESVELLPYFNNYMNAPLSVISLNTSDVVALFFGKWIVYVKEIVNENSSEDTWVPAGSSKAIAPSGWINIHAHLYTFLDTEAMTVGLFKSVEALTPTYQLRVVRTEDDGTTTLFLAIPNNELNVPGAVGIEYITGYQPHRTEDQEEDTFVFPDVFLFYKNEFGQLGGYRMNISVSYNPDSAAISTYETYVNKQITTTSELLKANQFYVIQSYFFGDRAWMIPVRSNDPDHASSFGLICYSFLLDSNPFWIGTAEKTVSENDSVTIQLRGSITNAHTDLVPGQTYVVQQQSIDTQYNLNYESQEPNQYGKALTSSLLLQTGM